MTRGSGLCLAVSVLLALCLSPCEPRRHGHAEKQHALSCRPDNEGSWSIGIYKGEGFSSLVPVEEARPRLDGKAAWPVANPVLSCASVVGAPSNFVADPFLFQSNDTIYMFHETKNGITGQGDIGVAASTDDGVTWQHLGIALDEPWHLSYPFVFSWQDEVYMLPEASGSGGLRLYKAEDFPLVWKLDRLLLDKPLIDASLLENNGTWWLFGTDDTRPGAHKHGELELYFSRSPQGPWQPHPANPIANTARRRFARMGGRPLHYEGGIYRFAQDCTGTYGQALDMMHITTLNETHYEEEPQDLGFDPAPRRGPMEWNGVRHHHMDALQLSDGSWLAVMDGDSVISGHISRGILSRLGMAASVIALGLCLWCSHERCMACARSRAGRLCCLPLVMRPLQLQWSRLKEKSSGSTIDLSDPLLEVNDCKAFKQQAQPRAWRLCLWKAGVVTITVLGCLALAAWAFMALCYPPGHAAEAHLVEGQHSKFTLVTQSYDKRLVNLKLFVWHYSRCTSVSEILVVWNKGTPPDPATFSSKVPLRFRTESHNSLNNRFWPDADLRTRAVLSLDDDILFSCKDLEHGFAVWRRNPERLVGFYPRLAEGAPLTYSDDKQRMRAAGHYNIILAGGTFVDKAYYNSYWEPQHAPARTLVDELTNCEDLLLNFVVANATQAAGQQSVLYVRPRVRIHAWRLSGVGISSQYRPFARDRNWCMAKFEEMFGNVLQTTRFDQRNIHGRMP